VLILRIGIEVFAELPVEVADGRGATHVQGEGLFGDAAVVGDIGVGADRETTLGDLY